MVLVLFGGSKLPDLANSLGKSMKEFVRSMDLMSTKVFPHLRHLEPPPLPDSL